MEKKLAFLIFLASALNGQSEYEEISAPLFSGLEASELREVFSDWEKEMKGKEIHRLYKSHGMLDWGLRIEHSPVWNAKQGCWTVQVTHVKLPEGKYLGLFSKENGTESKLSGHSTNYLYFGNSYKRVEIRGDVTRDEYEVLLKNLNKEDVIEFQHGEKVTGRYLSKMIDFIQKDNGKLFVGFEKPFRLNTLVCDIYSERFTYSAMFVDLH